MDAIETSAVAETGNELRLVGRHTLVYGVGVLLGKLAGFIMVPIYTHYLSTAEFGLLELLGTTVDVISMIAGIGLAAGMFKLYAELREPSERRALVSTLGIATLALALVTALLGASLSAPLTRAVLGDDITPVYFRLFFLVYFLQSACAVPFMLLQAEHRSWSFVALNVAKLVVMLGLNIYTVVVLRLGILGILASSAISSSVLAVGLTGYTFRRVGMVFSRHLFRRLAVFGAPIVLWSLGSFILTFSDRYFLKYYAGASAVGIYGLAYRFSFLLTAFAVLPFSQIWEPRRFALAAQANALEMYRRVFTYLNLALVLGAIAILLFARDALHLLVGSAFWPAYRVVPLLLVVTVIQQWTGYCNLGLYLKNRTDLYGWSALVAVIIALGLNALLIPRFGMMGAATATLIAYVVRFAVVYALAQARYPVPYAWDRVTVLAAVFGAAYLLRLAADLTPLPVSLPISVVLLTLAAAIAWQRVLDDHERAALAGILRRRWATRGWPAWSGRATAHS